jgi:hypothetical protein
LFFDRFRIILPFSKNKSIYRFIDLSIFVKFSSIFMVLATKGCYSKKLKVQFLHALLILIVQIMFCKHLKLAFPVNQPQSSNDYFKKVFEYIACSFCWHKKTKNMVSFFENTVSKLLIAAQTFRVSSIFEWNFLSQFSKLLW